MSQGPGRSSSRGGGRGPGWEGRTRRGLREGSSGGGERRGGRLHGVWARQRASFGSFKR